MSTLKEICKEQTEMIDEMRQNIKELTKESDRYKAENEKIRDQFDYRNQSYMKLYEKNKKLSEQYKTERDTLVDDLSWYKAKVSRLEREKEIFHRKLMAQLKVNTNLRMSNKDKHNLLSEISQHIGNKPSSSTYKYFRAKLDGVGIKEDE
ncbi:hypothetical protein [Staphylococcus equorum]|uniref:hypothetical protein n=1 Tax=Staphylococcus equorum TaxID=246432 RepID=UPI003D805CAC